MLLHQDYRNFRAISNNKLQKFSSNPSRPYKDHGIINMSGNSHKNGEGLYEFFRRILVEFSSTYTMHGVNRIFARNVTTFKKVTWILSFSICVFILIYVSYQVAYKYNTKPLFTVVANTRMPVYQIAFPEITICNRNRFNWQRFSEAEEVFLKPQHLNDTDYRTIFRKAVTAYDTLAFGKFQKFKELKNVPPKMLKELNYINFYMVSQFMAWKCFEIFSHCMWLEDYYECCEIFFTRNSQMGMCLAFNTIETREGIEKQRLDPFWPWRTKGQGSQNGLSVRVHLREYAHSPWSKNNKGILVMLAETYAWYTTPIEVNTHTKTSIPLSAILNTFDNNTRIFSSKVRKCVFEDELQSIHYKSLSTHRYMFENCQAQCQQEYLVKFCNCTVDLFYPLGHFRPCRISDFPCLYRYNKKFQNFEQEGESKYSDNNLEDAMKCGCLFNCRSLVYMPKLTSAYMNNVEVVKNSSYIDLEVYFQQDFLLLFSTTVIYTWTDLMASFGGLAGLCIGCSLVSLVEFSYFVLVDIPHKSLIYIKKRARLRLQGKSYNIKQDIIENIWKN